MEATRQAIHRLDPTVDMRPIIDRYGPKYKVGQAVFCRVDSISTQTAIWRSPAGNCRIWVDGRMLGEAMQILVVADGPGRQHYCTTLFAQADAQAFRGSGTLRFQNQTEFAVGVPDRSQQMRVANVGRCARLTPVPHNEQSSGDVERCGQR